jgi:hypothetical protein
LADFVRWSEGCEDQFAAKEGQIAEPFEELDLLVAGSGKNRSRAGIRAIKAAAKTKTKYAV